MQFKLGFSEEAKLKLKALKEDNLNRLQKC
jgi:hypothetical protein